MGTALWVVAVGLACVLLMFSTYAVMVGFASVLSGTRYLYCPGVITTTWVSTLAWGTGARTAWPSAPISSHGHGCITSRRTPSTPRAPLHMRPAPSGCSRRPQPTSMC